MEHLTDTARPFGPATEALELVATGVDLVSIVVLLLGAGRFIFWLLRAEFSATDLRLERVARARRELGTYILAGLELLIVSDVIHTAITLELDGLIFLGGLVVIRSIISFFLERELKAIEGASDHNRRSPPQKAGFGERAK